MKTESQLINKLEELLQMVPECYEVSYILSEFKQKGDIDKAFNQLSSYHENVLLSGIEVGEDGIQEDKNKDISFYTYWVNIGDYSLQVRSLKSLKKEQGWDKGRPYYTIKVNEVKSDGVIGVTVNTEVKFMSETARDKEWDRIHRRLSTFNFIRFL